jgi:hypothetical protein
MNKKINVQFSVLAALVLVAAFSRLIPIMPNFSPLCAIGLFGAAHFDKKWKAFLIPITATFLSDLFINNVIYAQFFPNFTWFYEGFYWQYGSYMLVTLASLFIFNKISAPKVILGATVSTAIFFLISNFGCWIGSTTYTQNFQGLMTCYAAGVPFLKGTFLGDLAYSGLLFGGYYALQNQFSFFKLPNVRYA